MIEKFNNIFYLIIFLIHFLGVGVYAFQTIVGTKSFMEKFSIDPTGAIMIRLAGGFMLAVFLMSIYSKAIGRQSSQSKIIRIAWSLSTKITRLKGGPRSISGLVQL